MWGSKYRTMEVTLPGPAGPVTVGGDSPAVYVVAEIGQNHQGDLRLVNDLCKVAHEAGADAVKFQKRHIPSDLTKEAREAPYHGEHSFGATYGEHREALELSTRQWAFARRRAQGFNGWPQVMFATACDVESVAELEEEFDNPIYKVASRDLDNLPLIEAIARTGKPVILSTGMHSVLAIDDALPVIEKYHSRIVIMHCVSLYPCPPECADIGRIHYLQHRYKYPVGISDHTTGLVVPLAAVAMGACVVEKHITLSRAMKGRDHAASLEPDGLRRLVRDCRVIRSAQALGRGTEAAEGIKENRERLGRSIVLARDVPENHPITEADLTLKSPGTGLRWSDRRLLIGRYTRTALAADTLLTQDHLSDEKPEVTCAGLIPQAS